MKSRTIFFIILVLLFAGCIIGDESTEDYPKNLTAGGKKGSFDYTLGGNSGKLSYYVYRGYADYLANKSRVYYCRPNCPSNDSLQQRYLDEKISEPELTRFLEMIKKLGNTREEQAQIAISLVQNIPYDDSAYEAGKSRDRYPYQVLYDNSGVCGEKVRLLSFLLRGLGYDTALLYYSSEKHAALGLKCPDKYAHRGTGYCFIETTNVAIPTYDTGDYPGTGRINSIPQVVHLSSGDSYDNIGGQWNDAREWQRLEELITKNSGKLERDEYDKWKALQQKYGIHSS